MNTRWEKLTDTIFVSRAAKLRVWLSGAFWRASVAGNKLSATFATPNDAKRAASAAANGKADAYWYGRV